MYCYIKKKDVMKKNLKWFSFFFLVISFQQIYTSGERLIIETDFSDEKYFDSPEKCSLPLHKKHYQLANNNKRNDKSKPPRELKRAWLSVDHQENNKTYSCIRISQSPALGIAQIKELEMKLEDISDNEA